MSKPIIVGGTCTINPHISKKIPLEHPFSNGQVGTVVSISADTTQVFVDFGLKSTPTQQFAKEAIVML